MTLAVFLTFRSQKKEKYLFKWLHEIQLRYVT